ncbi:MAG TPA: hypothetical protein VNN55_11015, partial [bacterium]|nr:hypothetical protein [bacterium]
RLSSATYAGIPICGGLFDLPPIPQYSPAQCDCQFRGDPVCDSVINDVMDVVVVIECNALARPVTATPAPAIPIPPTARSQNGPEAPTGGTQGVPPVLSFPITLSFNMLR